MPSLREAILKQTHEAITRFEIALGQSDYTALKTPSEWNTQRAYALNLWYLYKVAHDPEGTSTRGVTIMADFGSDFRDFVLPVLAQIVATAKKEAGPEEVTLARTPAKKISKKAPKKPLTRRRRPSSADGPN